MSLVEDLRRRGFRKWYERQLLRGHAHLALTFLCSLGVFAAVEAAMQFTGWQDRLIDTLAVLICGAVGLWSLRRYLYLLSHAEFVAHQADCPACKTYARFELTDEPRDADSAAVRCRQCGHRWTISG